MGLTKDEDVKEGKKRERTGKDVGRVKKDEERMLTEWEKDEERVLGLQKKRKGCDSIHGSKDAIQTGFESTTHVKYHKGNLTKGI